MTFALALPAFTHPFVDAQGKLTTAGRASLEEILRRLVAQLNSITVLEASGADLSALQAEIDAAESLLAAHIADTGNPHSTTAAQVGADPTGTAAAAVAAHEAAADPHPQYLTAAEGNAAYDAIGAAAAAQAASQPLDTQLNSLAALTYAGNGLKLIRLNAAENDFEWVAAGGGSGDVVGPASAVDSRIVLFDGVTGKLIKDSGKLLSDYGALATTNTWALAQTFTTAPVFTDQAGTRTALGLGTMATAAAADYLALAGGTMTGNISVGVDLWRITANTVDGADTRSIIIDSGNGPAATRGAYLRLYGNEAAGNPGQVQLLSGNGADILISGGTVRPNATSTYDLGASGNRWNVTYTTTINVSSTSTFTGIATFVASPVVPTAATGDNSTNAASTAYVRTALPNASYRVIMDRTGSHIAARTASKYSIPQGNPCAITGVGTLYSQGVFYLAAADYPTVDGQAAKLRLRAQVFCNDVAPTGTYIVGLYPVTRPAVSGGVGLCIYTIGTVVTGSETNTLTTPAADSSNTLVGSDFALPADGYYVVGMVTTGTVAASAHMHFSAQLQMRNA